MIQALQHVYSSVEAGYSPGHGRGFQTVAVSPGLAGTPDLAALEKASFYSVRRERRAAGDLPVKETFFELPSGRLAVGRTVDWGVDALGREGNSLTRHLIVERDALLEAGADPFSLLAALTHDSPGTRLTPGELPPLTLGLEPGAGLANREKLRPDLLASLAGHLVTPGEQTALLVGEPAKTREAILAVVSALTPERRLGASFCTYFNESDHLRGQFRLAAVESVAELPGKRESYRIFNQETGDFPVAAAEDDYGKWLVENLRARAWQEIEAFNAAVEAVRTGGDPALLALPAAPGRDLLLKLQGPEALGLLRGRPGTIARFLRSLGQARRAAELLLAAGPEELCGSNPPAEDATRCLDALREAASSRAWKGWVRKWKSSPLLAPYRADTETLLDQLRRRLPGKKGPGR